MTRLGMACAAKTCAATRCLGTQVGAKRLAARNPAATIGRGTVRGVTMCAEATRGARDAATIVPRSRCRPGPRMNPRARIGHAGIAIAGDATAVTLDREAVRRVNYASQAREAIRRANRASQAQEAICRANRATRDREAMPRASPLRGAMRLASSIATPCLKIGALPKADHARPGMKVDHARPGMKADHARPGRTIAPRRCCEGSRSDRRRVDHVATTVPGADATAAVAMDAGRGRTRPCSAIIRSSRPRCSPFLRNRFAS
jgi:hypothetical protein